jgi:hypothetical protein
MIVLLTLSGGKTAQGQGWIKHFGTGQDDRSTSVLQTADGGYFVAGYSFDAVTNNQNQYLFKTDPNGNLQWDRLNGPFFINAAWHATETPNGDLVITGEKYDGPTLGDAYIERLSPAGTTVWNQPMNLPNFQRGEFITRTSDGGFLLVGQTQDFSPTPTNNQDLFLVRTDSLGDTLWTQQYGGPGNDEGVFAVATSDGGYAVTGGYRDSLGVGSDFYLLRIDSLGNLLWEKTYTKNQNDFCMGLAPTADGGFLLAGYTVTNLQFSVIEEWVVRVDSVGDSLWSNIVGQASNGGESQQVEAMEDGGFVLCSSKELIRIDSLGNPLWNRAYPGYTIADFALTSDGGFILTGYYNNPPLGNDLFLMKTDDQGVALSNIIEGNVYRDLLPNCQYEPGDSGMVNWLIRINGSNQFVSTDSTGHYEVRVDTGTTTLEAIPLNGVWGPDCPISGQQTVYIPTPYDTVSGIDFAMKPLYNCPVLRVNLATPFLRPCFNNIYVASWCNEGTQAADSVVLTVELDSFITVDSTQLPFRTPQSGNTYEFDLGTVQPGECGSFYLYCTLSCNAVLGQAHCSQATLTPNSTCVPVDTSWDRASVVITATCEMSPDSVRFTVSNVGTQAMSSPGGLMVLEDDILKMQDSVTLGVGQDTVIRFPGNGSTWTLIADQRPAHPGNSRPIISMEGCGRDTTGDFSRGFLTQFPTDDADPWIDIDCRVNTAAYDPNIKTAIPEGQGVEHKILYDHDLEYTIFFQNTGTDTAFTVIVRDTLPEELDLTTLRLGAASDPFTFRIYDQRIAEWTFPNILLPDSNRNEPESHGFLTFRMEQRRVNEPGTRIVNTAGIYFDYNPPIITPPAFHLVDAEEDIWVSVFIDKPIVPGLDHLTVYPNPFRDAATFDLGEPSRGEVTFELWSVEGQKLREQHYPPCQAFSLERKELNPGVYLFKVTRFDGKASSGRVVIY